MPAYIYKAATKEGKIVEGVMEGDGQRTVLIKLQSLGYVPLQLAESSTEGKAQLLSNANAGHKKVKTKDLLLFTHEFNTLLRAGLPLDRCLMILEQLSEKPFFREVVKAVIKDIKGGKSLGDAMAEHPHVFPKVYVNMVKAGEMGGVLPQVLSEITSFLEQADDMRSNLISSLIYPVIIFSMMIVSVLVMILFVVPRFSQVFETSGMPVPLPMQILMAVSSFFTGWWWALIGGVLVVVLLVHRWWRSPAGRLTLDRKALTLPLFGPLVKAIEVARFTRTLGTLVQNAVPLVTALTLVKEVLNNQVVADTIEPIKNGVKKGEGLVAPMKKTNLFPPLSLHLLEVGEETGELAGMMLQAAAVYEKDVKVEIKRLISLFEPFMILFMGLVVGGIVVTMVYSIFSISDIPM